MSGAAKVAKSAVQHVDLMPGVTAQATENCVGIGAGLPPEEILRLATDFKFKHLCQTSGFNYNNEILAAEAIINDAEGFFRHPISSILTPTAVGPVSEKSLIQIEERFDSSSQKRAVIGSVTKYMESKGLSQTLIEDVTAVADEFFTNAVYNAPFIDPVTGKNPGVSRQDTEVKLDGGKFARLLFGHDAAQVVIACEDPFGSLNLERYLNKIKATYLRGPAATMNFGPGGAGLGSYIIFNAGSSLYFGVKPKQMTLLCCVIPLGLSYRKRVQLPKHLHWIQR